MGHNQHQRSDMPFFKKKKKLNWFYDAMMASIFLRSKSYFLFAKAYLITYIENVK